MPGERPCLGQERRPRGPLGAAALAQCSLKPPASLQETGTYLPKARKRPGQPEGRLGLFLKRPRERRPQVVVLGLQPIRPNLLLRPRQLRFSLFCQGEEKRSVSSPNRLGLPALLQLLPSVLPNRLQHPVAH